MEVIPRFLEIRMNQIISKCVDVQLLLNEFH
jgi:hypothetical protein